MKKKIMELRPYLPAEITSALMKYTSNNKQRIHEIRLRGGQPLCVHINGKNLFLTAQGELTSSCAMGYMVSLQDIRDVFMAACKNSVYAYSEQLKNGFLSLSGGNRMAIVGRIVYENGNINTIQNISSLSIRLAGEWKGCSDSLIPHIIQHEQIHSCAIISPPGGGKTTMLRDIARSLSLCGFTVSIIDERGEIAGMNQGVSMYDLGSFYDVLDGCHKKDGLMMALRGLSPDVMVVDELGSIEEASAITEGINGGVATIFSLHASSISQAANRAPMQFLLQKQVPDLLVLLSGSNNPGKICKLYNMKNREDVTYVKNLWNSSA